MLELFVVGTFWFWALIVLEILLLFVFVNFENSIGALISIVIFGACVQFLGNADILGYIVAHPWHVVILVITYVMFGTIWGTWKWVWLCKQRIRAYLDLKAEFLRANNLPDGVIPANKRRDWEGFLSNRSYRWGDLTKAPRVRDNKNRVISWMMCWPISLIWFFINDFVTHVFSEIYHHIAGTLQRIADNMWAKAGIPEDFRPDRDT